MLEASVAGFGTVRGKSPTADAEVGLWATVTQGEEAAAG
jgi:hypothetical protein